MVNRLFECQQNAPNQLRMHTLSSPEPIFFTLAKVDMYITYMRNFRHVKSHLQCLSLSFCQSHDKCISEKLNYIFLPFQVLHHKKTSGQLELVKTKII